MQEHIFLCSSHLSITSSTIHLLIQHSIHYSFISPSISHSLPLFYPSIYQPIHLSFHQSIHYSFISLSICLSHPACKHARNAPTETHLPLIIPSIHPSIKPFIYHSINPSIIHSSVYPSVSHFQLVNTHEMHPKKHTHTHTHTSPYCSIHPSTIIPIHLLIHHSIHYSFISPSICLSHPACKHAGNASTDWRKHIFLYSPQVPMIDLS